MNVISVVDDDASVRSATVDLLNSLGFACEAYGSAEEYLGSTRRAVTVCLVLDINMPGVNGLELQGRLAQSGITVPVIFITAFPEERTRAQAFRAGAVCYLAKPYSDEELLDCIHQALARRDAAVRPEDQGRSQ
ncbi:MAG TPA: response regulator [Xanthobacteraceae bacterium]|nr:response regulator [Xanthobacteraceae bacterium]